MSQQIGVAVERHLWEVTVLRWEPLPRFFL